MALRDITLGQYFPGESPIHRLDPRAKLVAMTCYIVALFLGRRLVTYGILLLALAAVVKVSTVKPR
ncbi:MAG: energy-coupling factor transporter transmembrane protein EcfT, partial [Oscillospiraceae bacterium]|nr:energy-coupling factor transporter transmembrane protein EcfT [Oscillospiraceae bacterium]